MSLQQLCLENMANLIGQMPPMLQEKVVGCGRDTIKTELRSEINKDVERNIKKKAEKRCKRDVGKYLEYLIPEIIRINIECITGRMQVKPDFYQEYSHIPDYIIDIAISTADTTTRTLEDRYVNTQFSAPARMDYSDEYSDEDY